ncbi:TetR/AcrR family transcriptional regulator [Zhihengliuella salsuginis]|uniref:TetR family transcriptional regulator n=1 Tax=Zhihengliuella salsuginis TaxID=578222 RepID=A0ABQ3GIQ1_9MICC|nr:TetR/AcrR family transcriptional regulator [Zhihengliuella salsuginis]GHD06447.1 TetR family transcriptional regulator [Zhihengliuella salsuginis]
MAEPADHRRRPRRRGETLRAGILDAALAELEETGYAGMTMERVAERAHAGKASLYRHWNGKAHLVFDATRRALPEPGTLADTGSLRGDLLELMGLFAHLLRGPLGEAVRGIVGEALAREPSAAALRREQEGRAVELTRSLVERAADRGENVASGATERQLEAGHAILRMHVLAHGPDVAEETLVGIVDEVMMPLLAPASRRPAVRLRPPRP